MRKLEVTYLPSGKTAHVPAGTTLFNAAHWAGLPIESTCGGRGTCGKCKVRVVEGLRHHEPTPADHRKLGEAEIQGGWRLSCQLEITEDATCEVPNLQVTPKAATMGVGRFVLLEPNVQKVVVQVDAPSLEDHRSHLHRLLDALEAEGLEPTHGPGVYSRLARAMADEPAEMTATLVGEHLVDVDAGDTTGTMFGISLDIGTTTVVATLVDLVSGGAAAVESTINRQAPFGADVIARMGHAMTGAEA
ncbi:MAG TPA: 2Fe-2S iron-sulfur cluster-binding protein, partial [Actinomycetota bacterium]|nr:2Fe-2S iron-sulfur cluster-binding protein [Actinomycetota bacterium]